MDKKRGKAWIISVDMGYGHDRAAFPLKDIAYRRIITANNDRIIPKKHGIRQEDSMKTYLG